MHERSQLGRMGEQLAAEDYEQRGFRVIDRNWHCREGELDLVVARGELVVFCEVKTRRGTAFGPPAEAVTFSKQRKLRAAALRWMQAHRGRYHTRFDVACVAVDASANGIAGAHIDIITNAF